MANGNLISVMNGAVAQIVPMLPSLQACEKLLQVILVGIEIQAASLLNMASNFRHRGHYDENER